MPKGSAVENVLKLESYRGAKRRQQKPALVDIEAMDEAMRNLQAAASAAIRLVSVTRAKLGLPQL